MNCFLHSSDAAVGVCHACGRGVCRVCAHSVTAVRSLACSPECQRITAIEHSVREAAIVHHSAQARMYRYSAWLSGGLSLITAVIPLFMLWDTKPGQLRSWLAFSSQIWLLSVLCLAGSFLARRIARRYGTLSHEKSQPSRQA